MKSPAALGDREQTVHEQRGHLWDEHEHGAHRDGQRRDLLEALLGHDAQDRAEHGADEDGLAEDADLLLKTREVDVDVTDAGDLVDDLVEHHAIGAKAAAKALGIEMPGRPLVSSRPSTKLSAMMRTMTKLSIAMTSASSRLPVRISTKAATSA